MDQPTVVLATLLLNEMEWLPRLYEQHRHWPGLKGWVFVEAADFAYAAANPTMVSDRGLSTDGTSKFLRDLASFDSRVTYVPLGVSSHADKALGKIRARNAYWQVADGLRPDYLVSVDADEFYTHADQGRILEIMDRPENARFTGFTFPRREIWRPPSIARQPLFQFEVYGGFWGIPCCHWWRWSSGVGHRGCHNTPQDREGRYLNDDLRQLHGDPTMPQMIHMGFAAMTETRVAKNRYYEERGEIEDPQRKWYTDSRRMWRDWMPETVLPKNARVRRYDGPVPEVFLMEEEP